MTTTIGPIHRRRMCVLGLVASALVYGCGSSDQGSAGSGGVTGTADGGGGSQAGGTSAAGAAGTGDSGAVGGMGGSSDPSGTGTGGTSGSGADGASSGGTGGTPSGGTGGTPSGGTGGTPTGGTGGTLTGGTGGTTPGTGGAGGIAPQRQAALIVDGGDATAGRASDGGTLHVVARGGVSLSAAALVAPAIPSFPAAATLIDSGALGADVTVAGAIRLDGALVTSGSGAVRLITSTGGDIFVSGSLRGADAGAVRQGLTLRAPSGTVYITGALDNSGAASGQGGGPIAIVANRVVVTGSLSTRGGDGATVGGAAGAITITATDVIYLGGPLELRGGEGTTQAGVGGLLTVDTLGAVQVVAMVDARGGRGASVGATAGAAGAIRIGEQTMPSSVIVSVPLSARGGGSGTIGGKGGTVTLEARQGDLVIAGLVDFGGGDGAVQPGAGGTLVGQSGAGVGTNEVDGGDIHLSGQISGNGGSVTAGGTGNGGGAGTLTLEALSFLGALVVDPAGKVALNGGASGGAGTAGGGGHLFFFTRNGDLTVGGRLSLRGGDARDSGGRGGLGGAVDIFSDDNFDGIGGNLLIDTPAVIDASGGAGTIGGSARNDGAGGVAAFPDDMEQIAVLINCDGRHGTTENWLQNLGLIIARGGAGNGDGGDIAYHGISPDRDSSPPSGNIDNAGDGTGQPGDFTGE